MRSIISIFLQSAQLPPAVARVWKKCGGCLDKCVNPQYHEVGLVADFRGSSYPLVMLSMPCNATIKSTKKLERQLKRACELQQIDAEMAAGATW